MTKEENKALIAKYPWLEPFNESSGKFITKCVGPDGEEGFWPGNPKEHPDYDYEYTLVDDFPKGWWKAFGPQMCEEIQQELNTLSEEECNDFRVNQIKEKYGTLRFYPNWGTENIYKIISKYEKLSEEVCIECGKPATKMSPGWISFYCDDCATENCVPINSEKVK